MTTLLRTIFNHDFSDCGETATFHDRFFAKTLTLHDLRAVCEAVCAGHITLGGRTIPAVLRIPGRQSDDAPFMLLAQLHGNEPAGLAGILLAMALSAAGKLERDCL